MEIGWLLDDGCLCVGAGRDGFRMVTYTDPKAIRLARREDADSLRHVMACMGMPLTARNVAPVEHCWMPGDQERFDA